MKKGFAPTGAFFPRLPSKPLGLRGTKSFCFSMFHPSEKGFLLVLLLLAILLSSGCVQPQQPAEQNRVEKYGFSLSPPKSQVWLDWQSIPFGEMVFQAMSEDMDGEPMLILIKPDSGNGTGMCVIAVMLVDNNSGYNDVSQIPQEALQAGAISGLSPFGPMQAKTMGGLNWIAMEAQPQETGAPFMSDVAITICGNKIAAIMLMNDQQGLEENRAYFAQIAESGQCTSQ